MDRNKTKASSEKIGGGGFLGRKDVKASGPMGGGAAVVNTAVGVDEMRLAKEKFNKLKSDYDKFCFREELIARQASSGVSKAEVRVADAWYYGADKKGNPKSANFRAHSIQDIFSWNYEYYRSQEGGLNKIAEFVVGEIQKDEKSLNPYFLIAEKRDADLFNLIVEKADKAEKAKSKMRRNEGGRRELKGGIDALPARDEESKNTPTDKQKSELSPLHSVIAAGNYELARGFLVDGEANPNARREKTASTDKDRGGDTPLDSAAALLKGVKVGVEKDSKGAQDAENALQIFLLVLGLGGKSMKMSPEEVGELKVATKKPADKRKSESVGVVADKVEYCDKIFEEACEVFDKKTGEGWGEVKKISNAIKARLDAKDGRYSVVGKGGKAGHANLSEEEKELLDTRADKEMKRKAKNNVAKVIRDAQMTPAKPAAEKPKAGNEVARRAKGAVFAIRPLLVDAMKSSGSFKYSSPRKGGIGGVLQAIGVGEKTGTERRNEAAEAIKAATALVSELNSAMKQAGEDEKKALVGVAVEILGEIEVFSGGDNDNKKLKKQLSDGKTLDELLKGLDEAFDPEVKGIIFDNSPSELKKKRLAQLVGEAELQVGSIAEALDKSPSKSLSEIISGRDTSVVAPPTPYRHPDPISPEQTPVASRGVDLVEAPPAPPTDFRDPVSPKTPAAATPLVLPVPDAFLETAKKIMKMASGLKGGDDIGALLKAVQELKDRLKEILERKDTASQPATPLSKGSLEDALINNKIEAEKLVRDAANAIESIVENKPDLEQNNDVKQVLKGLEELKKEFVKDAGMTPQELKGPYSVARRRAGISLPQEALRSAMKGRVKEALEALKAESDLRHNKEATAASDNAQDKDEFLELGDMLKAVADGLNGGKGRAAKAAVDADSAPPIGPKRLFQYGDVEPKASKPAKITSEDVEAVNALMDAISGDDNNFAQIFTPPAGFGNKSKKEELEVAKAAAQIALGAKSPQILERLSQPSTPLGTKAKEYIGQIVGGSKGNGVAGADDAERLQKIEQGLDAIEKELEYLDNPEKFKQDVESLTGELAKVTSTENDDGKGDMSKKNINIPAIMALIKHAKAGKDENGGNVPNDEKQPLDNLLKAIADIKAVPADKKIPGIEREVGSLIEQIKKLDEGFGGQIDAEIAKIELERAAAEQRAAELLELEEKARQAEAAELQAAQDAEKAQRDVEEAAAALAAEEASEVGIASAGAGAPAPREAPQFKNEKARKAVDAVFAIRETAALPEGDENAKEESDAGPSITRAKNAIGALKEEIFKNKATFK